MTTLELLIASRARIEDPKNWCQGTAAKDCRGYAVSPRDRSMVQMCSVAALRIETYNNDLFWQARDALSNAADYQIAAYQDAHTHAQVMAVWDKAIAAERAKIARPTDISSLTKLLNTSVPVLEAA